HDKLQTQDCKVAVPEACPLLLQFLGAFCTQRKISLEHFSIPFYFSVVGSISSDSFLPSILLFMVIVAMVVIVLVVVVVAIVGVVIVVVIIGVVVVIIRVVVVVIVVPMSGVPIEFYHGSSLCFQSRGDTVSNIVGELEEPGFEFNDLKMGRNGCLSFDFLDQTLDAIDEIERNGEGGKSNVRETWRERRGLLVSHGGKVSMRWWQGAVSNKGDEYNGVVTRLILSLESKFMM
ncbi:hypothetical protein Tco_0826690, partial [Tanacetum coccineum]